MSHTDLSKIRKSIELTLSQPGALFQVETKAEGIVNSSYGAVNFQDVSYTSKDSFRITDSEMNEEAQIENNEIISLFHQGVIFLQMEINDEENQWTAFETDDPGWDSSNLAPLFWLQGVEQVTALESSHYQLTINMQYYIAKKPTTSSRAQTTQTLENSVPGLSKQKLDCEIKCDADRRVEWMSIIIPNDNNLLQKNVEEKGQITSTTISLRFTDTPPAIMKPDTNKRFSANEFIQDTIEQAEQELAAKNKEEDTE